jgi:hypothetical protein
MDEPQEQQLAWDALQAVPSYVERYREQQVDTEACPEGFSQKSPAHLPEPLPESYWIEE